MGLHQGIDTVAVISSGIWSKTYGHGGIKFRYNLFASLGFLEEAPAVISDFAASLVAMRKTLDLRSSTRNFAFQVEKRALHLVGKKRS